MKKRILCAALAAMLTISTAAVSAFAAETSTTASVAKGTFRFDSGEWESSDVRFVIYDKTTKMYATKTGWTSESTWVSKEAAGTRLDNGTFESFEFEYPEGHELSVDFLDIEKQASSYTCNITPDVFGDIARIVPEVRIEGATSDPIYSHAVKFDRTGFSARRDDPSGILNTAAGSIYFDASKWGSSRIQFYIYDVTETPTKFATKDGWVEDDPWGSDKIEGFDCGNGRFSSFDLKIPDDHEIYVIFCDPDTGSCTYECVLTVDAVNDTAEITDKIETAPSDDPQIRHAKFIGSKLSTRLGITSTGEITGETIHPCSDRANDVAKFILNCLGKTNKSSAEVVTAETAANAIAAFDTNAENVWAKYQTFSGDERYNETGARAVLFPEDSKTESKTEQTGDLSETESKTESETTSKSESEKNTSSSNESKVTSPKTGYNAVLCLFPILIAFTGAAAVMLAKRKGEE